MNDYNEKDIKMLRAEDAAWENIYRLRLSGASEDMLRQLERFGTRRERRYARKILADPKPVVAEPVKPLAELRGAEHLGRPQYRQKQVIESVWSSSITEFKLDPHDQIEFTFTMEAPVADALAIVDEPPVRHPDVNTPIGTRVRYIWVDAYDISHGIKVGTTGIVTGVGKDYYLGMALVDGVKAHPDQLEIIEEPPAPAVRHPDAKTPVGTKVRLLETIETDPFPSGLEAGFETEITGHPDCWDDKVYVVYVRGIDTFPYRVGCHQLEIIEDQPKLKLEPKPKPAATTDLQSAAWELLRAAHRIAWPKDYGNNVYQEVWLKHPKSWFEDDRAELANALAEIVRNANLVGYLYYAAAKIVFVDNGPAAPEWIGYWARQTKPDEILSHVIKCAGLNERCTDGCC